MKRPGWATAVGVIGIIWGCLGIFGAALTLFMPVFMPKLLMEAQSNISAGQEIAHLKMMTRLWDMPYLRNSCLFLGLTGILVSGFFIFASISLLQMRRSSIKLIYSALCIEILFNILLLPDSVVLKAVSILSGVVIYVILLLVVAVGNKRYDKNGGGTNG